MFQQPASVVSPKFAASVCRHSGQVGDSAEGRISLRLKLARPGIQEIPVKLDYRFRGNDERETPTYSVNF